MLGLRSNFADALAVAAVVAVIFLGFAILTAVRRRRERRPWVTSTARISTMGAALTALVATAYPREGWLVASEGDLVLMPGRGGLGDLDQIIADPGSLAAILLFANVLLYVPIGFFGAIGWHRARPAVLLGALALSVAVEALQYSVLGRVASTDDVLLNLSGATVGLGLGLLVLSRLGSASSVVRELA